MYIEDLKKRTPSLEIRKWNAIKWAVFHEKAGCVCLGTLEQCHEYLHKQSSESKGRSPEFER